MAVKVPAWVVWAAWAVWAVSNRFVSYAEKEKEPRFEALFLMFLLPIDITVRFMKHLKKNG